MNQLCGGMYSEGFFDEEVESKCHQCGIKLFIARKDEEKIPVCFECNLKNIAHDMLKREYEIQSYNYYKTVQILTENGFVENPLFFEGGTATKYIKSYI